VNKCITSFPPIAGDTLGSEASLENKYLTISKEKINQIM
jgi:hypothetical protein